MFLPADYSSAWCIKNDLSSLDILVHINILFKKNVKALINLSP